VALAAAILFWPREQPSAQLLERAEDAYFQYTRGDNETAIALYEQALIAHPDEPAAQAGLARALVQRVLRWPNPPGEEDFTRTTLGEALASGRLETPQARVMLDRAHNLVMDAAQAAPNNADVQLALGLTLAARRDFIEAEAAYQRALAIDSNAWGALINLGDLADIRDAPAQALPFYERAFETMERTYAREPQRIRPWQAEVGVLIASRHNAAGRTAEAERWYRRVLSQSPMHSASVDGLAALLVARGDAAAAQRLCVEHTARAGQSPGCGAMP
jgi:tetratricopeptide (TPR) repeat protein